MKNYPDKNKKMAEEGFMDDFIDSILLDRYKCSFERRIRKVEIKIILKQVYAFILGLAIGYVLTAQEFIHLTN